MRKNLWANAALLIAALLAATPCAHAQSRFRPRIGTETQTANGKTRTALTVNDQIALTLRASLGGLSPEDRAQAVADRLDALVGAGLQPGEIVPRPAEGRDWQIKARGEPLLLIPRAEALAQSSSAENLSRRWTASLRRLLALPPLSLSTRALVVPLGETRIVTVGGAARSGEISARGSDEKTASSSFDEKTRTLTVRGAGVGNATVEVRAANDSGAEIVLPLSVSVMRYAAQIAPTVTISVTGTPAAPAGIVAQAVYAGLSRAVNAEPGAVLRVTTPPKLGQSLTPGSQTSVRIPITLTGENLLPVDGSVVVTVANQTLTMRPAVALYYSNNPEQVKKAQPLFAGRLSPLKPVRLDYHHQNMSGGALVFHADLTNETDSPAAVQIVAGICAPGADTVQVGRRAGAAFLQSLNGTVGIILDIPPHSRVPLVTQRFADGLTVSGIVQMQQVGGADGALSLRVSADGDAALLQSPLARVLLASIGSAAFTAPTLDLPPDYGPPPPSPHVFGPPLLALAARYEVGGKWVYVRVGHTEALKDASGKLTLFGNYGASYEIALTLFNPTTDARIVGVYFAPEAGYAAGVFQIDGGPIQEFDPTPPPAELVLARVPLAPGETRIVRVKTIPLNGSSYPISVIAHALPASPTPSVPLSPSLPTPSVPAPPPGVGPGK